MALPPSGTTDQAFLREVDEELRREQLLRFWRRWGRWLVIGVVVALAAFAAWLIWGNSRDSAAGALGEKYEAALADLGTKKGDSGAAAFQSLANSGNAGFAANARMLQADALLAKNDLKGAAAKFGEIASDASLPQPYRDLALVRQTAAEYDALKPEQVIDRLKTLASPNSPWFGTAGDMVAVAYYRQGKRDVAGKLWGEIAQNEKVPVTVRQRAVQMAGVLGVDAIDQGKEKTAK